MSTRPVSTTMARLAALALALGACQGPGGSSGPVTYDAVPDVQADQSAGDASGTDADAATIPDADATIPDADAALPDADATTPDTDAADAEPDVCSPDCAGKACGDDGCGGTCGSCEAGDVCGVDGQCKAAACDGAPLAVTGLLVSDVASVPVDGASADVTHKLDIDPDEDGCVTRIVLTVTHAAGCQLTAVAEGARRWQGGLRLSEVTFTADSFCPGFPDAAEGTYSGIGGLTLAEIEPTVWEVPDAAATESCFEAGFTLRLGGVLTRQGDGEPLDVTGTEITATGFVVSAGNTEASCPCAGDCATAECGGDGCGYSCGTCSDAPDNGAPVCQAGQCVFECDGGFEACGDAECVPAGSVVCGGSCDPCPVPDHGSAACDGDACGIACDSGYHDCGGACVSDGSVATCGGGCSPCPAPSSGPGQATCDGSTCGLACSAGYHLCGDACVSDSDAATCGSGCSPCPEPASHGEAVCTAGGSCDVACEAGYHYCGGDCVPDDDVTACGSGCVACTAPANATASCDLGACTWACDAGTHDCGGACVSDSSVSSCGTSCTPCTAPSGASPTCEPGGGGQSGPDSCVGRCGSFTGGNCACDSQCVDYGDCCADYQAVCVQGATSDYACGWECLPGYNACAGGCASPSNASFCGPSCTNCYSNAPPQTTSSCVANQCVYTCYSGTHDCGGTCVDDDEVATCGSSCTPCPEPANGYATCDGSSCGIACDPNVAFLCQGGTACCVPTVEPTGLPAAASSYSLDFLIESRGDELHMVYRDSATLDYVWAHYDGDSWSSTPVNTKDVADSTAPAKIAVSPSGEVTVAWVVSVCSPVCEYKIAHRTWTGSAWTDPVTSGPYAYQRRFDVGYHGEQLYVAYATSDSWFTGLEVRRWNGTVWGTYEEAFDGCYPADIDALTTPESSDLRVNMGCLHYPFPGESDYQIGYTTHDGDAWDGWDNNYSPAPQASRTTYLPGVGFTAIYLDKGFSYDLYSVHQGYFAPQIQGSINSGDQFDVQLRSDGEVFFCYSDADTDEVHVENRASGSAIPLGPGNDCEMARTSDDTVHVVFRDASGAIQHAKIPAP